MLIKYNFKISDYCNLRLFDKTTFSFVGNQRFTSRKYTSLRRFAEQYAKFTTHHVAIIGIDRYDYMTGSWQWFEICEVC